MPLRNHFRHQRYSSDPPTSDYTLLSPDFPPQPGSDGYVETLNRVRRDFHANVDSIYLIHGTFAGTDSLGWVAQLDRIWPAAGAKLSDWRKGVFDRVAKDSGNYTESFAQSLQDDLGIKSADGYSSGRAGERGELPVRLFNWSSENTHCGRARAAIELLCELLQRAETERQVQIWCHSHAGNVVALVTNLLGADDDRRNQFLKIAASMIPDPMMERLKHAFQAHVFENLQLDVVTFGTPIRYGWETTGYRKLLHVINHVPRSETPDYLAALPKLSPDSLAGNQGDFVQLMGVAGTDFLPFILDFTLMRAERALADFLAPGLGRREVLDRVRIGMRVPDEGATLLVDYDNFEDRAKEAAGHAIYTNRQWVGFHLSEIAKRLY